MDASATQLFGALKFIDLETTKQWSSATIHLNNGRWSKFEVNRCDQAQPRKSGNICRTPGSSLSEPGVFLLLSLEPGHPWRKINNYRLYNSKRNSIHVNRSPNHDSTSAIFGKVIPTKAEDMRFTVIRIGACKEQKQNKKKTPMMILFEVV